MTTTRLNREKYRVAHGVLDSGVWRCDTEAGLVYGARGRPLTARLNGYAYGTLPGTKTQVLLHRVLWEWVNGEIPDGLEVNHKNLIRHDNRASNLELVTSAGNRQHAEDTGAWTPQQGEEHGMHVLAEDEVRAIRRSGQTDASLAATYGVSAGHVKRVRRGRSWAHLDAPAGEKRRPGVPRLNLEKAASIRAAVADGASQASQARLYGVSNATICDVIKGRKWT